MRPQRKSINRLGVSILDNSSQPESTAQEADTSVTETAELTAPAEQDLYLSDPKSSELSAEYVGRWSTLISTTNWEKGKIIIQWREALKGSETPNAAFSDEAWSQRVGGVTPQHVGRLRRVQERFGNSYESYTGIYWSHFLAALDWDDAEMYLEGAVQSKWSVSQMRRTRWEANGGDPKSEPRSSDIVTATEDEDFTPLSEVDSDTGAADDTRAVAEGPRPDGPDFGDESEGSSADATAVVDEDDDLPWEDAEGEQDSPFVNLPSLPVDFADAVEQFKLAIIRHRADSWSEVKQDDVIQSLDILKTFTTM